MKQSAPISSPPSFAAGGNWLLTSASAKVDLARRMRAALNAVGLKLYASDSSPFSAALHFSDEPLVLPSNESNGFLALLLETCAEKNVRVILPSRDADLRFFAAHRDLLLSAGIWPLVSSSETIDACLDKIRFHERCLANGLPVLPRIEFPTAADCPCFVRPRFGSAGVGAGRVPSAEAMRALHGPPPWADLLVQPLCADREYTIDALFGLDGKPVQWISRERIRVKAGESSVGRTVSIPALDALVPALATAFPLLGPATIQAFHSEERGAHLVEINPRFGGAAALGIEAGLDTPRRLVALAQGDINSFLRPRPLRLGLTMLRYTQDLFLETP